MAKRKIITGKDTIYLRLSIMIELLMIILDCRYSEAYKIIVKSKTYKYLVEEDFATLYDSPQANLSDIGKELRENHNRLGMKITDQNIIKATTFLREQNKKNKCN